ncbi:hypothetical protein TNCV_199701 [Trichonephila clavipes]|nr:hypothetical protein TNCV_199701 [Trichonephila clavipes]
MENTHRRPSGKRPKKRRFRGNQIMKIYFSNEMHRPRFRVIKNLFCAVMSLPKPVEQKKSHDVINNKLSRVMKEVAEESMKMAAVEEYSSSPDNL